jgi:hypothetical protein
MSSQPRNSTEHVFISYVREDAETVDKLAQQLRASGATVWLDRNEIAPGEDWQEAIRRAIETGTYFVAVFSFNYKERGRTHMNEELAIAIKELRKRPRQEAWFLPVLIDPDTIPNWEVDANRTLQSFQYIDLYDNWQAGVMALLETIAKAKPQFGRGTSAESLRFKRPVSATSLTRRGLFEGVITITHSISFASARHAILRYLETGHCIPASSLYYTPSGADNWITLCSDITYRRWHDALTFWRDLGASEVACAIADYFERHDFDYISLGCGDGRKDSYLVNHWLKSGVDLTYYPYDISERLLITAVSTVVQETKQNDQNRLHINAVQADFDNLSEMDALFKYRPTPSVFSLLGNDIAMVDDERQFFGAIRDMMSSEDLIFLEVPLEVDERQTIEDFPDSELSFFFGPLSDLGVRFDAKQIGLAQERGLSRVKGTTTQVVKYSDVQLDGQFYSDICLARIHLYVGENFMSLLAEMGFDVIYSNESNRLAGQSLVCVARRTI